MIDFTIETHIERPADEVFAYVTDPALLATWQTNTVSAVQEGDGPLAPGSRIREVHRAPGGRHLESLVEVSELEPGRTFALHVVEGTPIDLRMTFEPDGDGDGGGTRMALRPHGSLPGLLRVAQPVLQVVLKRQFARQCATLKQVLEAPQVAAPA